MLLKVNSRLTINPPVAQPSWPRLAWGDVGHKGSLSTYSGSYTITEPNVTLENFLFTSTILQKPTATNLTIRNCHFNLSYASYAINNDYTLSPATDLLVEDCTLEGTTSTQFLLGGSGNRTIRRCQLRDGRADFFKFFGSGENLVEACYLGGLSRTQYNYPAEDFHADCFQNNMTGGSLTIRGTTWDTPPNTPTKLKVFIPETSWLYADAVQGAANQGQPVGEVYYRGVIAFFPFQSDAAVNTLEYNHFYRMPTNGIQGASSLSTIRLKSNRFYPSGIYNYATAGHLGTWVDLGDNRWAETGLDLRDNLRTEGTLINF